MQTTQSSTAADPDLVRLLRAVPDYYRRVTSGFSDERLYTDSIEFVSSRLSSPEREWRDLDGFLRQELALIRAQARLLREARRAGASSPRLGEPSP